MSEIEQLDPVVEFAENPDPRCACVLLLDTSASMRGEPIAQLNKGLQTFKEHILEDTLAARRVEVAIVTFDSTVQVVQDFVTPDRLTVSTLQAVGETSMGRGILTALDLIQARKQQYQQYGIPYYRPWILLITDGAPTDTEATARATRRLQQEEAEHRVVFFAVGVHNADMERLQQIASREPLPLQGLHFAELFVWLSKSVSAVAQSRPGEQVGLPSLQAWAAV